MVIIKRKTPGRRVATHIKREKTSKHKCVICNAVLHGMKRGTNSEIRKVSKSQRRPARAFGGQLCTKCSRKILILRTKLRFGILAPEEIPLSLRDYVGVKDQKTGDLK